MILEKNKIHKVKHVVHGMNRNYIIFSPIEDVILPDDFFGNARSNSLYDISCHFVIRFDSNIVTRFDSHLVRRNKLPQTGIYQDCTILELNNKDIQEIKKVMEIIGHEYKYNRKLNTLISCS